MKGVWLKRAKLEEPSFSIACHRAEKWVRVRLPHSSIVRMHFADLADFA